ncbi:MAG: nucleotidyltransferase family protein [Marvinbryantia sp.]|jgi:hypothetical protein
MKDMTLVIMAAGIGSRFGGGIKQLEPVGPHGEIIMDYSIKDAIRAGFNKIVVIIRKDLEKDFRETIGCRIEKLIKVEYVFQELTDLPEGFSLPKGRTKPWGTGQAILACRGVVNEPFAVINADDYYGREAFAKIHDYLTNAQPFDGMFHFCMAGFILKNTLSENGGVTRGICHLDQYNHVTGIQETRNIIRTKTGAAILSDDGTRTAVSEDTHVSMNMWGLTPDFIDYLADGFGQFLGKIPAEDLTAEYLLPTIIDGLLHEKKAEVTLLETHDKWFGVTYREDKEFVVNSIKELIARGFY